MREIKFRAWDKRRGLFQWGISNVCLTLGGHLMWQFGYNTPDLLGKEESENYILQQYTGLKDKNGKEIYEGDIVKIGDLNKQVFMRLGCWFVEMGKELGYYEPDHLEVIGNIYENPELLGS